MNLREALKILNDNRYLGIEWRLADTGEAISSVLYGYEIRFRDTNREYEDHITLSYRTSIWIAESILVLRMVAEQECSVTTANRLLGRVG